MHATLNHSPAVDGDLTWFAQAYLATLTAGPALEAFTERLRANAAALAALPAQPGRSHPLARTRWRHRRDALTLELRRIHLDVTGHALAPH